MTFVNIFKPFFNSIWSMFNINVPIINLTFFEISIGIFLINMIISILKNMFEVNSTPTSRNGK